MHLTPGKPQIELGLEQIAKAELRLVVGHHPISWFSEPDQDQIKAIFRQI